MMNSARYWALAAVCVLGVSSSGCAIQPDAGDEEEIVADASEAARTAGLGPITIDNGTCARDGIILLNGRKFRLGVDVGEEVTGISDLTRGGLGPVCHNQAVWRTASTYACAANVTGSFVGSVPAFTEFFRGTPSTYPAFSTSDGLYFGHADLSGPCPNRQTQNDFVLDRIECCETQPRP